MGSSLMEQPFEGPRVLSSRPSVLVGGSSACGVLVGGSSAVPGPGDTSPATKKQKVGGRGKGEVWRMLKMESSSAKCTTTCRSW